MKNPYENVGFFSYCTFLWFVPTILKGYRTPLTEQDLFCLKNSQKSCNLGDRLEEAWKLELTKPNPSLSKAIIKVFWKSYFYMGLIAITTEIVLRITQSVSFYMLLKYFSEDNNTMTITEGYIYSLLISICNLGTIVGTHQFAWGTQCLFMNIRVACCSLIYRKSLKISKNSTGNVNVGYIMNLVTNDVVRFDYLAHYSHSLWLTPLQVIFLMVAIYCTIGWTGIIGLIIFIAIVPLQLLVAQYLSVLRLEVAKFTDERIKIISEILSGIQVIKMYCWEKYFTKVASNIRSQEIKKLRFSFVWLGIMYCCTISLQKLSVFVCILVSYLMGYTITPLYVFSVTGFYLIVRISVNYFLPLGLHRFAELKVSLKRIEEFLLMKEAPNIQQINKKPELHHIQNSNIYIEFKNVSAVWDVNSTENTLENINVFIPNSKLVAVIGQVGSGKSSFLNMILKELFVMNGEVNIQGTVSYCPQEAWFFRGTLKENILFGQQYNEERYKSVIKACALERDISLLPNGDNTIIAENGENLSGGQRARVNLARAVYKQADIYLLDDSLSAVDTQVAEMIFNDCICRFLCNKVVILVTNQLQFLKYIDYIYFLENGKVSSEGTYKKLREEELEFLKLLKHDEEKKVNTIQALNEEYNVNEVSIERDAEEIGSDDILIFNVFKNYIKMSGSFCVCILTIMMLIIFVASLVSFEISTAFWSTLDVKLTNNATEFNTFLTREDWLIILSSTLVIIIVSIYLGFSGCFDIFINSSKNLYNSTFKKVIYAPMNFFHANSSGRTLNRFSRDLGLVDEYLPVISTDLLMNALVIIATFIIVAAINYVFVIFFIIMTIIIIFCTRIYLPSSAAIKRLEGSTKSPVYTHIKASFNGLPIIRTFNKQEHYKNLFDFLQDFHTSSFFMYLTGIHCIGFIIDFLVVIIVSFVSFGIFFIGEMHGTIAGLAITQSFNLMSIVQWSIRLLCENYTLMTSIERISEYLKLDVDGEDDKRDYIPEESWPKRGEIKFIDVNLRYKSESVLKNLNFTIKPNKKIGIVGRTGAGKTSICSSLFQLAHTDGTILIDDVDVKKIPLINLRNKISIIPQEPLLFSDTMRNNLDPFQEFTDEELWKVLEEVELKDVVADLPEGLFTKMTEGGSKLSAGQRQLVCLARALIKKNKILIMDEATANVDPKTDALIQSSIREKFKDCTVLTIAHRLHTIIDCDLIMVMDGGKLVEFDHPHVLLEEKGMFFDMVEKAGSGMIENLYELAENNWWPKYYKKTANSLENMKPNVARVNKQPFSISHFHYFLHEHKTPGYVVASEYINAFTSHTFHLHTPKSSGKTTINMPITKAYADKVPILKSKIEHLNKMLPYIEEPYLKFYQEILKWPSKIKKENNSAN